MATFTKEPQSMATLLAQSNSEKPTLQNTLAVSSHKAGNIERIREMFNPLHQARLCRNTNEVFSRNYPALATLGKLYGQTEVETIVALHIHNLSEYTGVKDKLTPRQMHEIASIIVSEYGYLTITEIIYFFYLFKAGRFGKFYGVVDGLVITNALRDYMEIRNENLDRLEQLRKKAQAKKEEERMKRECLTYEEYQELQWLFNMGYEKK